jgi:hypothetical protein
MLVLLLIARPRPLLRGRVLSYGIAFVLAGLLGATALLASGPHGERALSWWRGEPLLMTPAVLDAGTAPQGTVKSLAVEVYNGSGRTVRLLGGTVSCSCTVAQNLPCDVAPGTAVQIPIQLTFKGTPGEFQHRFELLTNDKKQSKLQGIIVGTVAEDEP